MALDAADVIAIAPSATLEVVVLSEEVAGLEGKMGFGRVLVLSNWTFDGVEMLGIAWESAGDGVSTVVSATFGGRNRRCGASVPLNGGSFDRNPGILKVPMTPERAITSVLVTGCELNSGGNMVRGSVTVAVSDGVSAALIATRASASPVGSSDLGL